MILDELIHNRAQVNAAICTGLAKFEADWGIKVTRYEVQDISFNPETQNSMQMQSSAERVRRAQVVKSGLLQKRLFLCLFACRSLPARASAPQQSIAPRLSVASSSTTVKASGRLQ
jgi:regulator of protease activity HflC (stomatin/prohibitin superfamily)